MPWVREGKGKVDRRDTVKGKEGKVRDANNDVGKTRREEKIGTDLVKKKRKRRRGKEKRKSSIKEWKTIK